MIHDDSEEYDLVTFTAKDFCKALMAFIAVCLAASFIKPIWEAIHG